MVMLRLMPNEPKPTRVMLPTFLRRSLWTLGVLYVVYLIVGNLLLNSASAMRLLNRRPEAFQVQWSHGETWWPGYLRVSNLRLRGQARQWLWVAEGESASGRVLLWPLLRHEIRFKSVEATQVDVDVQSAKNDLKPLPWSADAWWITADRIQTTSLRKLQWNDLLLTGSATAAVGFTHQLHGGITRIFASDIRSRQAVLGYGSHWRSQDVDFNLHFFSDAFTHDQPPGWRKLELATFRLAFEGTTPALNLGDTPAAPADALSKVDGHLSADITLDHGVLAEGGRAHWKGVVAAADASGVARREWGEGNLAVRKDQVDGHLSIPAAADALANDHLALDMSFDSQRMLPIRSSSETMKLLSGSVAAHWHFASLSWLKPLASKKPWLQWDGAGEVDTALHIEHGHLQPGSRLDIPQLDLLANILGNRFSGVASAKGRVVSTSGGASSAMNMSVRKFVLSPIASPGRPYLRGAGMQLNLQSSDDLSKFRDTALAHLQFSDAEVPDLQAYNHYLPGKSLFFIAGHGSMSADLNIDGEGDVSAGRMQMRTQAAQIALGTSRLTGNLNMDTQLAVAKRTGHAFDLRHFSLSMDGVHMDGVNDPSWWTTITLERGRLDWDRPMQLDAVASMRMKNVSVLLALFAKRSAFPAWIGHIVDDGEARATSRIQAGRGEFVMDDLQASNQRIQFLARLRIADGKPDGDVYARWGLLSVGVALANDQRQFHWAHAASWYQAQPALLPQLGGKSPGG